MVPFEEDSGDEDGGASGDQDADEAFTSIMSPTAGADWRYWDGADRLEESRLKVRGSGRVCLLGSEASCFHAAPYFVAPQSHSLRVQ